ncbi:hypothetical protein BDV96DRAFT_586585 [Lophiotrema nucula]|uniref:Uncharacterized protein n=1 Tax=Lophiotrema nucula TaxID=690887 RepID=A0A6A5YQ40_9PLEO|nr:hypothetical protein BDV96DRAFT_586585 [Lophiotrema nucula]
MMLRPGPARDIVRFSRRQRPELFPTCSVKSAACNTTLSVPEPPNAERRGTCGARTVPSFWPIGSGGLQALRLRP